MANQPIIKKRDKATSIAIFRDEYTNAQGEIKNRFSVSIQRSYKDKSGEWKQTSLNCFLEDLLPISTLCENAYIEFNKYIEGKREAKEKATVSSQSINDFDDDIPF